MFSELQTSKTVPHFADVYGLKDLSALMLIFIIQCYNKKFFLRKKPNKQKKQKLHTESAIGKMTEKELRTREQTNCFFPEEI